MTSSPDTSSRRDALPPALASMWRLCKLGYRHEPTLIVTAFTLALVAALPDALLAFWFKLLGEGAVEGDWSRVRFAVVALAISATATWFLVTVSVRVQRRFRDKVTIALESHVATLLASITTIAHQERPEYLDRLAVLRNQVFMLDHMYMSLFTTCGWILRLGITIVLLVSVHPALALLVLFAIPPVFTSTWRPGIERRA
jgi:ATP-binding cassette, subfamily B, bacterial